MRYKASFLSGLAAGYVFGARAGRERYDQLRRAARAAVANPQVQHAADTVQNQAGHFVGSAVRAATDKGKAVTQKVGDKLPSRLSEKLPASFGGHPSDAEAWRSYAHTGTNGATGPGAGTSGTTGGTTGTI